MCREHDSSEFRDDNLKENCNAKSWADWQEHKQNGDWNKKRTEISFCQQLENGKGNS